MKSSFPLDRVNNFSDAIYAIAITLLVLEIKIPSLEEVTRLGITGVLQARIPHFVGFLVSFFVTASFWRNHLLLFRTVTVLTNRLLWLNLWQLLFVVLMPFSTALYSYYVGSNNAFFFYCLNVAAIGFMGYVMTAYVVRHEESYQQQDPRAVKWFRWRMLITPFVFLLCIPLVFINPWVGRAGFVLIFFIQAIGDRRSLAKKSNPPSAPVTAD